MLVIGRLLVQKLVDIKASIEVIGISSTSKNLVLIKIE